MKIENGNIVSVKWDQYNEKLQSVMFSHANETNETFTRKNIHWLNSMETELRRYLNALKDPEIKDNEISIIDNGIKQLYSQLYHGYNNFIKLMINLEKEGSLYICDERQDFLIDRIKNCLQFIYRDMPKAVTEFKSEQVKLEFEKAILELVNNMLAKAETYNKDNLKETMFTLKIILEAFNPPLIQKMRECDMMQAFCLRQKEKSADEKETANSINKPLEEYEEHKLNNPILKANLLKEKAENLNQLKRYDEALVFISNAIKEVKPENQKIRAGLLYVQLNIMLNQYEHLIKNNQPTPANELLQKLKTHCAAINEKMRPEIWPKETPALLEKIKLYINDSVKVEEIQFSKCLKT